MEKGINVLSLFDGMSCGQIALERIGIKVDNYFASEVDKHAIKVTQHNYPNTVQLGDVTNWENWDIDWSRINLVTGGFPCQSWSVSGKQLGDKDPRGQLFWTTLDIMKKVLSSNPKAMFLLENVKMKKEFEEYITHHTEEALGKVNKHLINSSLVSAQNRNRYYWTNLPNIEHPKDRDIKLKDILEHKVSNKFSPGKHLTEGYKGGNQLNPNYKFQANTIYNGDKMGTLCAGTHGYANGYVDTSILCGASRGRYLVNGVRQDGKMKTAGRTKQMLEIRPDEKTNCLTTVGKDNLVTEGFNHGDRIDLSTVPENRFRTLTPLECERLQTVPDNYTLVLDENGKQVVSNTQRYKMLGNGWTVDVIAHIFKNLK